MGSKLSRRTDYMVARATWLREIRRGFFSKGRWAPLGSKLTRCTGYMVTRVICLSEICSGFLSKGRWAPLAGELTRCTGYMITRVVWLRETCNGRCIEMEDRPLWRANSVVVQALWMRELYGRARPQPHLETRQRLLHWGPPPMSRRFWFWFGGSIE